ncbi:unnamed protein product, partial [Pylaiella littoralis]
DAGGFEAVRPPVQKKAAPKVTLKACLGSAQTSPSLRKTVGVCTELFARKKVAFHAASLQTLAAKEEALNGAAAAPGTSEACDELTNVIRAVEAICLRGKALTESTLEAVDDAVRAMNPTKVQRDKLVVPTGDLKWEARSGLGEIMLSDAGQRREDMVHAPAKLILTTEIRAHMTVYVQAVKLVVQAEEAVFKKTGKRIMVSSSHIGQENT